MDSIHRFENLNLFYILDPLAKAYPLVSDPYHKRLQMFMDKVEEVTDFGRVIMMPLIEQMAKAKPQVRMLEGYEIYLLFYLRLNVLFDNLLEK